MLWSGRFVFAIAEDEHAIRARHAGELMLQTVPPAIVWRNLFNHAYGVGARKNAGPQTSARSANDEIDTGRGRGKGGGGGGGEKKTEKKKKTDETTASPEFHATANAHASAPA